MAKAKANGKTNGNKKKKVTSAPPLQRVQKMVPYSLPMENVRAIDNSLNVFRGSDFFSQVVVRPATEITIAATRILATIPVTPSGYPGTRLTIEANNWERYRFRRFSIRYVPAVPVSLACQLLLYIDTDPNDNPTKISSSDALIRQGLAQTGAQVWNFHVPKTIPMAMRADRQLYYTGIDKQNKRFSQMGTAYLLQVTSPVNFSGEPISQSIVAGSLFLDWEVEFQTQQLNPNLVQQPPATLTLNGNVAAAGSYTTDLAYTNTGEEAQFLVATGVASTTAPSQVVRLSGALTEEQVTYSIGKAYTLNLSYVTTTGALTMAIADATGVEIVTPLSVTTNAGKVSGYLEFRLRVDTPNAALFTITTTKVATAVVTTNHSFAAN